MVDVIVLLVLAALIGSAVAYIVKAKKSGAKCIGCPSGGSCPASKKPKKKKLDGPVIGKKTIEISGMHCAHCVANIQEVLDGIDGVRADVSLAKGTAVVAFDREIGDDVLRSVVEMEGYQILGIERKL